MSTTKTDDRDNLGLENLVKGIKYDYFEKYYTPTTFALKFINFIKLVNGGSEENKSPLFHLDMLDAITESNDVLIVCFRGGSKTTVMAEYMILYLALHGELPNFGKITVGMYVSDTMDNGVKSMRDNLEFRWNNSEFLQKYIPKVNFTDKEWEFENIEGKKLCFRGFGASTGVRGFKRYGVRPQMCIFDDLMSDKSAESPTITADIAKIIYKAARAAMHPRYRKLIWIGTPFNKKDPLYQGAATKAWKTKVYPICEKFPCSREEFKGAWEDRFDYDFVKHEYDTLLEAGKIDAFNQELMLRIMSDDDRLVKDNDIHWYTNRVEIIANKHLYNWYITTDFATSEKEKADFTVISVWAVDNKGNYYWVDGVLARQLFSTTVDDLFRLVKIYDPLSVGIEVTGQQQGFISVIERRMLDENFWFTLASDKNSREKGLRPNTDKLSRFSTTLPLFINQKIWFPKDLQNTQIMIEALDELTSVTKSGFKSVHDDFCDTVSQLTSMFIILPVADASIGSTNDEPISPSTSVYFDAKDYNEKIQSSYFV